MPPTRTIYRTLLILLLVSGVCRAFLAGWIELGNDEVYYWTYAKYPALSHFDHPPMVGIMIQLFTLDLTLDSEFFLRLAAVVLGTMSTWMIFLAGRAIGDALTGLYAAFLFTASFYGTVLTGIFILPDAPQVFFWLLTLNLYLRSLPDRQPEPASRRRLLLAGLTAGLALLSKYHAVFLVTGMVAYVLLYNRRWLRVKELYISLLIFLASGIPILLWNLGNGFISFTYHESRVGITESGFQWQFFLTELAGQFFYNNPVNVILILLGLGAMLMGKLSLASDHRRIILWVSLPLLVVFTSFSLFRSTLPHWTGPAYLGFLLIAAAWIAGRQKRLSRVRLVPVPLILSMSLLAAVLFTAAGQIRFGWVDSGRMGTRDVSADMAGWHSLGDQFEAVAQSDVRNGLMPPGAPVFTFRWFPAANLDYYVGRRTGNPVYALGSLERIHKYYWINQIRGTIARGSDAYYLGLSDDNQDPAGLYGSMFDSILPPDTLMITRRHDTIRKVYVYRLINLKQDLTFP